MNTRVVLAPLLSFVTLLHLCEAASSKGQHLVVPTEIAKYVVYAPRLFYPVEARISHIEGEGLFQLNVDRSGAVTSVEVVKSTGNKVLLDAPTIIMFKAWRFRPLPRGCEGVLIPVKYKYSPW